MKALLVKGQVGQGSPVDHAVTTESFTLTVSVSKLTATLRDFDVSKEDLWLVWYQWDPNWKSWRVLQSLSGPVENKSQPDGALVVRRSSRIPSFFLTQI
jgi:hypothetical protein